MCLYPPRDCATLPPRRLCLSLSYTRVSILSIPFSSLLAIGLSRFLHRVAIRSSRSVAISLALAASVFLPPSIGSISSSLSHVRRVFLRRPSLIPDCVGVYPPLMRYISLFLSPSRSSCTHLQAAKFGRIARRRAFDTLCTVCRGEEA